MLDFSKVFKTFTTFIRSRTARDIKVIQSRSTVSKPLGVYATFDIINVANGTGYELNRNENHDDETITQETHKDISIRISIRNSSPEDLSNQMNTYSYINNIYNAMNTDSAKEFFRKELDASVLFVNRMIPFNDIYPTGVSSALVFDATIRMKDFETESADYIYDIVIDDMFDSVIPEGDEPTPPACEGLSLVEVSNEDLVYLKLNNNFIFKSNNSLVGKAHYEFDPLNVFTMFELSFSPTERSKVEIIMGEDIPNFIITNVNNNVYVGEDINNLELIPDVSVLGIMVNPQGISVYADGVHYAESPYGIPHGIDIYVTNNDEVNLTFNKDDIRFKLPDTIDICGDDVNG